MKKLFTPGPLNTSHTVKQAMMQDVGSRDEEFISAVKEIRAQLLSKAPAPLVLKVLFPAQ
jgi:2-aminoethylphosphonate-pyruvate transaminase